MFPEAKIFTENAEASIDYLTANKIECFGGGPPCQDHCTKWRTGNSVVGSSGSEFETWGSVASQSHGGVGVAYVAQQG